MADKKKSKDPGPAQFSSSRQKRVPLEELDKQIAAAETKLRGIAQLECDVTMPVSLPNDPSYRMFFPSGQHGEEMSIVLFQGSGALRLVDAPRYLKEGAVRQLSAFIEHAEQMVGRESRDDAGPEPYAGSNPEEFAAAIGIADDLAAAIQIAKECFEGLEQHALALESDPESTARWIAIQVDVTGSVGDVVSQHNAYCQRISRELSDLGLDNLRLHYQVL